MAVDINDVLAELIAELSVDVFTEGLGSIDDIMVKFDCPRDVVEFIFVLACSQFGLAFIDKFCKM